MYDNNKNRNTSYIPRKRRTDKQQINVQVESRTCDGLELPCRITWRIQRTFRVDRVFGCKRDPDTGEMEYAIRIGTHATRLWRRPDGTYYVLHKK